MNRILLACLAVLVVLGVMDMAKAETTIYRWVDARGVIHFSQDGGAIPTNGGYEVFQLPGGEGSQVPDRVVIPLKIDDGVPSVEVSINDTWEATFLVDTAASVSVMNRSLVESLGMDVPEDAPRRLVRTAQGTLEAVSIQVESLSLGSARKENIEVIVPLEGMVPNLLGQNFLSDYIVTLDRSRRVLELKPAS